jgi:hypothetical protein
VHGGVRDVRRHRAQQQLHHLDRAQARLDGVVARQVSQQRRGLLADGGVGRVPLQVRLGVRQTAARAHLSRDASAKPPPPRAGQCQQRSFFFLRLVK